MIIENCLNFPNIDFKTEFHRSVLTKSGRKTKQNLILSSPLKVTKTVIQTAVKVLYGHIFNQKYKREYQIVRGL